MIHIRAVIPINTLQIDPAKKTFIRLLEPWSFSLKKKLYINTQKWYETIKI
jgi:hypothetical protein